MSSEMRENDVSKLSAEEAVKCDDRTFADWLAFCGNGYEAHGSSYNLALIEAANRIASRALLARTEAGADECEVCKGAGTVDETLGGYAFSNPKATCPECDGLGEYTHPRDASGDAEWREFTRDDLPPATHQTFIAPRGLVWCWVGHEVIDIVNKHAAAMQAKEAK